MVNRAGVQGSQLLPVDARVRLGLEHVTTSRVPVRTFDRVLRPRNDNPLPIALLQVPLTNTSELLLCDHTSSFGLESRVVVSH